MEAIFRNLISLSPYFRIKKIYFLFILPIVFFCLALPLQQASAAWYDYLIGAFTFLPMMAVAVFILLLAMVSVFLAAFSGVFVDWVLSGSFISWSYTDPANNPIIKIGLEITRGFTNMFLVLILVYIGLATILRLAGHDTKRMLGIFLLIALLVNFSHVICGLIVDASNIATNFFITKITGGDRMLSNLETLGKAMWNRVTWTTFKFTEQTELAVELLVFALVNFNIFIILILYGFIFMARIMIIWKLVILSPLAFASYILPATRRLWSMWWAQFTKWCLLGVTMGFWFYLADQFATIYPENIKGGEGFGAALLPHIFAVTLLYLGFVNGLVAASAGTDATIKLSRRGTKYAVDKVWGGGAKPYLEEKFKTREKTGKAIDWAEQNKFMGATKLRSLIPMAARDYAAQRPHIADAQKEVANSSSPSIGHRIAYGDLKGEKAVGGMMELVARGDFQDYFKAFQDKFLSKKDSRLQIMDSINYNRPSGRKITNIDDLEKEATASELQEATMGMSDFRTKSKGFLQLAMNAGYQSNLLRSSPRMAKVAAGLLPGYDKLNEDQAVEKAVNEARNQHIKNWEKEELDDEKVIEYGMTRGRDFWQAVQSNVKKGHETALETVAGIFNKFIQSSGSGFQGADLSNEAVRKKAWSEFRNNFNNGEKRQVKVKRID